MRIPHFALPALAALPFPAAAQEAAPPIPVPVIAPGRPMPVLVHYDAAAVQCGGVDLAASYPVTPYEALGWRGASREPVRFRFRIDSSGRTLGITRIGEGSAFDPSGDDLGPALAATRFAAGPSRRDCVATYTPSAQPIDTAPKAQLYRYYGMPHRAEPFDRAVFDALTPAGSNCYTTAPKPRTINFPDFDAIAQAPGTSSYVVIGYDVDAAGVPVKVRVLGSDGNAALDRAGVEALTTSRFYAAEPRTGCIFRYYRRHNDPMPVPPSPDVASYKLAGACKDEPNWARMPRLNFPPAYNRRAIEGWAMIGYDVAPWGETGNIRVLASEPSADFGKAAVPIVKGAHQPANSGGLTGCVTRVLFRLPPRGSPERDEDEDPIVLD